MCASQCRWGGGAVCVTGCTKPAFESGVRMVQAVHSSGRPGGYTMPQVPHLEGMAEGLLEVLGTLERHFCVHAQLP